MAILDLQRRLAPAGRIRIGEQVATQNGKKRPSKLTTFRFTSSNRRAVEGVAQMYGGDPHPWQDAPTEGQWEVFTDASEIPVVVPPERMSFSQWFELWSAGGCQRRCDGRTLENGGECICDPENRQCDMHSRLSVMLANLPGIGLWRLDTKGYYAATEMLGSFEIADMLVTSLGRSVLPGLLRLEERVVKRDGQTKKFVVPVLDFEVDMAALASGHSPIASLPAGTPALPEGASDSNPGGADAPSGLRPIPASTETVPSVADQLRAVDDPTPAKRRANSAPPLPATSLPHRTAAEVEATAAATEPKPPERRRRRKTEDAPADTAPPPDAQAQKPAPVITDQDREQAIERAKTRTKHLPSGELRITQSQVKLIQTLFGRMDTNYTREQRLIYCRNVVRDDSISTTWDLSVGQANELIENLRIVNGEEPPPREGEDAA